MRQRHADPDRRDHEAVLADLENGVTSLWLVRRRGRRSRSTRSPTVLDGVYLDLAPVVLDAGADVDAAAEAFLRPVDGARRRPRGRARQPRRRPARAAGPHRARPPDLAGARRRSPGRAPREYPRLRARRPWTRCRTTTPAAPTPQELGCSLAAGVAYLRALTEAGLSVDEACAQLEFRYAATADQFPTIAKLRAARRLWARVAEVVRRRADGARPAPARRHLAGDDDPRATRG